jgi:hypothetical protein
MSLLNAKKQYRLRVEICIGTIIDVHRHIKTQYKNDAFISQFENLKRILETLDMQGVSEKDIVKVEKATNDLLCEFRPLFETEDQNRVYTETVH